MEKSFLRTGVREVTHTVTNDGEILSTDIKDHKYLVNTKEEFFLCYSALIGAFMEMSAAEIRVFGYLLRYSSGSYVDVSKKMRIEMSTVINLNERTIFNTMPLLLEKGIVYRNDIGLYTINPKYAFKGSRDERNKALKAIIELELKEK